MILVLGYWLLGNIHRYWVVLLLGDIFCCSDTQYNTNQTAVSTVHMPVSDYLVSLVICTLTAAIVCLDATLICCLLNTVIVIIIVLELSWSLLCYTPVLVLVLGISIARGQYYWVLDIGCFSWYRSNPIHWFIAVSRSLVSVGLVIMTCECNSGSYTATIWIAGPSVGTWHWQVNYLLCKWLPGTVNSTFHPIWVGKSSTDLCS